METMNDIIERNRESSNGYNLRLTPELQLLKTSLYKFQLYKDNIYDEKIIYVILTTIKNDKFLDDNVRNLLRNIDVLTDKISMGYSFSEDSSYNSILRILTMSTDDLNLGPEVTKIIFNHELGHVFHDTFLDKEFRPEARLALKNSRNRILSNPNLAFSYIKQAEQIYNQAINDTFEWYDPLREQERKKVELKIKNLIVGENINEIKPTIEKIIPINRNRIDKRYDEILEQFNSSNSSIDDILNNEKLLVELMVKQNNIAIQERHLASIMYSESNVDYIKLSAMINSVVRENSIFDSDGNKANFPYLHDKNSYWDKKEYDQSYNELIADYFSLVANGRTEALAKVEEILGTELMDELRYDVARMNEKMNEAGLKKR